MLVSGLDRVSGFEAELAKAQWRTMDWRFAQSVSGSPSMLDSRGKWSRVGPICQKNLLRMTSFWRSQRPFKYRLRANQKPDNPNNPEDNYAVATRWKIIERNILTSRRTMSLLASNME